MKVVEVRRGPREVLEDWLAHNREIKEEAWAWPLWYLVYPWAQNTNPSMDQSPSQVGNTFNLIPSVFFTFVCKFHPGIWSGARQGKRSNFGRFKTKQALIGLDFRAKRSTYSNLTQTTLKLINPV